MPTPELPDFEPGNHGKGQTPTGSQRDELIQDLRRIEPEISRSVCLFIITSGLGSTFEEFGDPAIIATKAGALATVWSVANASYRYVRPYWHEFTIGTRT